MANNVTEVNVLDVPLYTQIEAARYLRIPFVPDERSCDCNTQESLTFPTFASRFVTSSFVQSCHPLHQVTDEPRLFTDVNWVISQYAKGMGSLDLQNRIALYQSRVECKDGRPVQIFPFSRQPAANVPRLVVMDPEIRFGQPTVKGVPTTILAERWLAGDSPAELADDYDLTSEEVDEALRFEASLKLMYDP